MAGVVNHPPASRDSKVKARQVVRNAEKVELALPAQCLSRWRRWK